MSTTIDTTEAYRVAGHGGIAWYVLGYVTTRDEDYEWTGIETEDPDRVRAVMVGDDHVWTFDVEDLSPLNALDYCRDCGQIGCGHNVYE